MDTNEREIMVGFSRADNEPASPGRYRRSSVGMSSCTTRFISTRTRKSTLGSEPLRLALVGYPLIAEDLEDLPNFLKELPSQAPALLALPEALGGFIYVRYNIYRLFQARTHFCV